MNINDLLIYKRPQIIENWINLIAETCPEESSIFLKNLNNRLNNQADTIVRGGIQSLFDGITCGAIDKTYSILENILKVRAVQDLSASQAVGFMPLLKKAVWNELSAEIPKDKLAEELLDIESKIDELTLISFDIYMKCRERLFQLRAKEVKDTAYRFMQRANRRAAQTAKQQGI
ncbi:MAG: RsbRD N-terminal domain-containing protein [Nitrospirae bacterium]|nr:RsbRD N-terminal domain-containing protein [Nitrospirota bacterium]